MWKLWLREFVSRIYWIVHFFLFAGLYSDSGGGYLYTLIVLLAWLFEAVRTNPGYEMATQIYNNLLNLSLGTVMLVRSNYIIQEKMFLYFLSNL